MSWAKSTTRFVISMLGQLLVLCSFVYLLMYFQLFQGNSLKIFFISFVLGVALLCFDFYMNKDIVHHELLIRVVYIFTVAIIISAAPICVLLVVNHHISLFQTVIVIAAVSIVLFNVYKTHQYKGRGKTKARRGTRRNRR